MKYEIGQTLLVPAKVVAVGNIDKSEDQHLTIQFPNGAQITNYPSKDVSEVLEPEKEEELNQQEKKSIEDFNSENPVTNDGQ